MPRFAVAALHRNLSLLAVVFLGVHVATTLADTYAPIGVKDAFIPFLSSYRPLWLGLGAVACDLLLALIVTSLLRVRLGLRTWRLTHWFAYACWPVALLHALGTGSDPRAGWLQVLAAACVGAVLLAGRRCGSPAAASASSGGSDSAPWAPPSPCSASSGTSGGPSAPGWAARAGTPASLLHHTIHVAARPTPAPKPVTLPNSFSARLHGTVSQSSAGNGLVDVHLDGALAGGVQGTAACRPRGGADRRRRGSMTSSGVAFAARGTQVFEGWITALSGTQVAARVSDGAGRQLDLVLDLRLGPDLECTQRHRAREDRVSADAAVRPRTGGARILRGLHPQRALTFEEHVRAYGALEPLGARLLDTLADERAHRPRRRGVSDRSQGPGRRRAARPPDRRRQRRRGRSRRARRTGSCFAGCRTSCWTAPSRSPTHSGLAR